jgi:hypothetical protein
MNKYQTPDRHTLNFLLCLQKGCRQKHLPLTPLTDITDIGFDLLVPTFTNIDIDVDADTDLTFIGLPT